VDDLEKLFAVKSVGRGLAELEIEEVDEEPSLLAVKEAAADGTDDAMVAVKDGRCGFSDSVIAAGLDETCISGCMSVVCAARLMVPSGSM
jgi:hypothetical protein